MISRRGFLKSLGTLSLGLTLGSFPYFKRISAKLDKDCKAADNVCKVGSICPVCGSTDIDVCNGRAICHNEVCGAEFVYKMQISGNPAILL